MTLPINQIITGDCLEVMRGWPDKCVDLIVTDPPYGIKRDKGFDGSEQGFRGGQKAIPRRRYEDDHWDKTRPNVSYFLEMLRVSRAAMIFGGNYFADILPQGTHWIVWDKINTLPSLSDCELVWTNSPRNSVKKITVEYNGLIGKEECRVHPTQKPLEIMLKLIAGYSGFDTTIFDPFAGSGTTCVAAQQLGRKFIGIEISEKYCQIARDRLRQRELFNPDHGGNT